MYNLPLACNLRLLEIAAGIGLLFAPEKIKELSEEFGKEIPQARNLKNLRSILQ